MRYLKKIKILEKKDNYIESLFDELSELEKEEFYFRVGSNEVEIIGFDRRIQILQNIKNVLGDDNIQGTFVDTFHISIKILLKYSREIISIIIKRMEDEYFFISLISGNYYISFKCDQEDGLILFFKDLKKIIESENI